MKASNKKIYLLAFTQFDHDQSHGTNGHFHCISSLWLRLEIRLNSHNIEKFLDVKGPFWILLNKNYFDHLKLNLYFKTSNFLIICFKKIFLGVKSEKN
jgi:hypothetical protein